ncbi:unnamed protein product [Brassica oleracea var. botrytis]
MDLSHGLHTDQPFPECRMAREASEDQMRHYLSVCLQVLITSSRLGT